MHEFMSNIYACVQTNAYHVGCTDSSMATCGMKAIHQT